MLTREVMDTWALVDRPDTSGDLVRSFLAAEGHQPRLLPSIERLTSAEHFTDVLTWHIPGADGKQHGGEAPTLAVIGRLGGVGVRPRKEGTVSDADGAIIAIATALKLARSHTLGEPTRGDVIVVTHLCPAAPTRDVPVAGQMDSPVPANQLIAGHESPADADALISVDTTRSHYLLNHTGIAITPTLVNGAILRISEDLLALAGDVTSEPPVVLPITMQDITPTGNGLFRINSIMQPGTHFTGPLIGLASISRHPIRGTTTGANRPENLEQGARFCVEAARRYGRGTLAFHDPAEYARFRDLYGDTGYLVGRRDETSRPSPT